MTKQTRPKASKWMDPRGRSIIEAAPWALAGLVLPTPPVDRGLSVVCKTVWLALTAAETSKVLQYIFAHFVGLSAKITFGASDPSENGAPKSTDLTYTLDELRHEIPVSGSTSEKGKRKNERRVLVQLPQKDRKCTDLFGSARSTMITWQ
jgi:hypothetical protein